METEKFGIKALDETLGKVVAPSGSIISLYGENGTLKTLFALDMYIKGHAWDILQLYFVYQNLQAKSGNILIIVLVLLIFGFKLVEDENLILVDCYSWRLRDIYAPMEKYYYNTRGLNVESFRGILSKVDDAVGIRRATFFVDSFTNLLFEEDAKSLMGFYDMLKNSTYQYNLVSSIILNKGIDDRAEKTINSLSDILIKFKRKYHESIPKVYFKACYYRTIPLEDRWNEYVIGGKL